MKLRRLAALLSLLLVILPSPAYADARFGYVGLLDGVQYHNDYADEGDIGGRENYLVFAPDKYSAAVMAIGGDVNALTAEQKLKLSDSNYGGDFYTYAQTFQVLDSLEFPDYVPAYVAAALAIYYSPFGDAASSFAPDSEMYTSSVASSLYNLAKASYQAVIDGEDVGGGSVDYEVPAGYEPWSGGSVDEENLRFELVPINGNAGSNIVVDFRPGTAPLFGSYAHPLCSGISRGTNKFKFCCFSVPDGVFVVRRLSDGRLFLYNSLSQSFLVDWKYTPDISLGSGGVYAPSNNVSGGYSWSIGSHGFFDFETWMGAYFAYGSGVPDPDGDWPSDSGITGPSAPVVPDPDVEPSHSGGDIVIAPSVNWPDIDITITNNNPSGTDPTDYTPWLEAINGSLNSLRSDLLTEFDAVLEYIRNVYTFLLTLDDVLETHCLHLRNQIISSTNHLESYLNDLFAYLTGYLDFSFDDSGIIIWLKRIYTRLGSGNKFHPDPVSDDDGFFKWLTDLWQKFMIDLVSVLPESMGEFVDLVSQLTHYFPFSIPFDIFALLSLFSHAPVTPSFDLPMPFTVDQTVTIHVDLSVWDGVAALIRPCFLVIFCLKLALLTKDLMSGFDINKGGV